VEAGQRHHGGLHAPAGREVPRRHPDDGRGRQWKPIPDDVPRLVALEKGDVDRYTLDPKKRKALYAEAGR